MVASQINRVVDLETTEIQEKVMCSKKRYENQSLGAKKAIFICELERGPMFDEEEVDERKDKSLMENLRSSIQHIGEMSILEASTGANERQVF